MLRLCVSLWERRRKRGTKEKKGKGRRKRGRKEKKGGKEGEKGGKEGEKGRRKEKKGNAGEKGEGRRKRGRKEKKGKEGEKGERRRKRETQEKKGNARKKGEGRSHDVRLRDCTCVHCSGYGAVRCTSAVSCRVLFCVRGAAGRHGGRRNFTSIPKGVTPAAARTALFLLLPVRSCREGRERFVSTLLAFRGLASSGRVTPAPSASDPGTLGRTDTVHSPFQTRVRTPDSRFGTPRLELALVRKPGLEAASSRNPDLMLHQSDTDLTLSPLDFLRVSGKKRPKTVPADQRAPTQDVVTSMSGSAVKRAPEKPPVTAKGVPEKRKPFLGSVPIPGFSGRCLFPSLCTRGSNVPRFQCPEVPMSRCFDSGFQCPEGGKTRLC